MNPTFPSATRYDAIVVGARVAGAATALRLAHGGRRVLAVERGRYGSDTLSTLALMRGGVFQLNRWGVLERLLATSPPPIRETKFHYADEIVPFALRSQDGVDALYAPRRAVLDAQLVDAARAAGAEVVHELRVVDLVRDVGGKVTGVVLDDPRHGRWPVAAQIVIGADGADSVVARRVGAPVERAGRRASGVVYGFFAGLGRTGFHWHFNTGVAAGVIPTHGGLACVFAAVPSQRFEAEIRRDLAAGHARVLGENDPALAEAVAGARRVGPLRGFPGRPGHLRRAWGPGWALVGDAGYFKDPITANGITDALRDAELVARAVRRGTKAAFAEFQALRDTLSQRLFEISDEIAGFDWSLAEVQALHVDLSREMNREVIALRDLDSGADL